MYELRFTSYIMYLPFVHLKRTCDEVVVCIFINNFTPKQWVQQAYMFVYINLTIALYFLWLAEAFTTSVALTSVYSGPILISVFVVSVFWVTLNIPLVCSASNYSHEIVRCPSFRNHNSSIHKILFIYKGNKNHDGNEILSFLFNAPDTGVTYGDMITGSSFGDENESTMGDRLTFIPLLTGMEGNQEFMGGYLSFRQWQFSNNACLMRRFCYLIYLEKSLCIFTSKS